MIEYLYLGRVGYDEGLRLQAEIAGLVAEGRLPNVLLLLEHPPVLTLGRNANRANVLATDEVLARRGVTVHEINRGGDVTYHGPGQLVGYPIFDLRALRNRNGPRMGPVDFVRLMEEALIRLCAGFGVQAGRVPGLTGVWCGVDGGFRVQGSVVEGQGLGTEGLGTGDKSAGAERKIGAIGIHVAKGITSHGFAFNVTTDLRDFGLIVPCGIADHAVTSLEHELERKPVRESGRPVDLPTLEAVAHRAARQFGAVFDQPMARAESLAALRAQAVAAARAAPEFPAEDTPLRVPAEVERLLHKEIRPVQA
ncbi:MAG: lipoyl(octanoyl) transferase LipB [Terracidiphilus sp.]